MTGLIMVQGPAQIQNIKEGKQTSILMADAPKGITSARVLIGEAGMGGRDGMIVGEFVCNTRIDHDVSKAIPERLLEVGCTDKWSIRGMSRNCQKPVTEFPIENIVFYDEPHSVNDYTRDGKMIEVLPRSWSHVDYPEKTPDGVF